MHDPMAKTTQERWRHNAFEHWLNAQGYIGAFNKFSFGLLG